MEKGNEKQNDEKYTIGVRLQNVVEALSKCKQDFISEKEECKKMREINAKLEVELKETRELEKSHRYHLMSSREMIANLQETVSQLVHLKRDMKTLKDETVSRDITISTMEKVKDNLIHNHNDTVTKLRNENKRHIEELTVINERKIQEVQQESDTQIMQFTCVIEEMRTKMAEMEAENRDKMNVVVLEYEEKIQRGAAQVAQLQEQLARQASRNDASIDAYRRRLEELEEKLKQSQFKQYLAQSSYTPHYDTQIQVEGPYSVNRDPYSNTLDVDSILESNSTKKTPMSTQSKTPKQNTLQVMYYGNRTQIPKIEKKGQFNISKKRKLYNDKDFQDF